MNDKLKVTRITTNHDEIKHWAEDNAGIPVLLPEAQAEGNTSKIYIDFLENGRNNEMKRIEWDEFFERFDKGNYALEYEDKIKNGVESRNFKFIKLENKDS